MMEETTDSDAVDGLLSTSMVAAASSAFFSTVKCVSSEESEGYESS